MERVDGAGRAATSDAGRTFHRILVPMKLGIIGEEMLATAVKLAGEHDAEVRALHVIRVPLEQPLDAAMVDEDERAPRRRSPRRSSSGADLGVDGRGG